MRLLLVAAAGGVAMLIAFLVLVAVVSTDEQEDCSKIRDPGRGVWQAGDFVAREQIVEDLSRCERLQGRSREAVEALLGPPSTARAGELRYRLAETAEPGRVPPRDTWVIFLGADGRVSDTRFDVVTGL